MVVGSGRVFELSIYKVIISHVPSSKLEPSVLRIGFKARINIGTCGVYSTLQTFHTPLEQPDCRRLLFRSGVRSSHVLKSFYYFCLNLDCPGSKTLFPHLRPGSSRVTIHVSGRCGLHNSFWAPKIKAKYNRSWFVREQVCEALRDFFASLLIEQMEEV